MRGVFLDALTMKLEELETSRLLQTLDHWDLHETTTPEQTAERIKEADVVITNKVVLDRTLIENASRLKLICVCATGTNNIDHEAAAAKGIAVRNVTGYTGSSLAQHTIALLLALATRWHLYNDDVKRGLWSRSPIFCRLDHPVVELEGKVLGIIGYGDLGRKVARVGEALGMRILVAESHSGASHPGRVPLQELLEAADAISLHCPLTGQNEKMVNRSFLQSMKRSAFLINTARGGLVDESALREALQMGWIAGAALDVLSAEPPAADHVLLADGVPNLIITPHNAWISRESRQRLLDGMAANIREWQQA